VLPNYDGPYVTLGDIVLPFNEVTDEFMLKDKDLDKWYYLKGKKKEERKNTRNINHKQQLYNNKNCYQCRQSQR
jgi:DNA (cytosine-5)-methyltransferase 1